MTDTLLWYMENIVRQVIQMLPCMGAALLLWLLLSGRRQRLLDRLGLYSGKGRDVVLLLFLLFCSGLCGLTLVPYGFWGECIRTLLIPGHVLEISFPTWQESLERLRQLPESITPFREITKVPLGGPWLLFIFLANIGMFAPVGFALPLLWRKRRWYHALLTGVLFSSAIEFIQVFVGRVSDVDDVLLNTLGTMVGFWLYCVLSLIFPSLKNLFHLQEKGTESEWMT